jgi:hypothetical protein
VLLDGPLVERVDSGRLGHAAPRDDLIGDGLQLGHVASCQEEPGSLACERSGHGAADGASGCVDDCGLVLEQHVPSDTADGENGTPGPFWAGPVSLPVVTATGQSDAVLARARAGDEAAFRELTEGHRRALLPDPRLAARRRGHGAGDAPGRLAQPRDVRGARVRALLALPDRDQPLPQRAARPIAPSQGGAGHGRPARAHTSHRAHVARALPRRAARQHGRRRPGAGGALRVQGVDRALVHRRPPAPAAPPARGAGARRRARLPHG